MSDENVLITPSTNALGFYTICQTKDQSLALQMVHQPLFYLSNLLSYRLLKHTHTHTHTYTLHIVSSRLQKNIFTKVERYTVFSKTSI